MQKKCSQYDLTTELSKKYSHTTYLASPVNSQSGHAEPERQVVLTLFASSLFRFPHEREKLLQKARYIKELQHRHLVPILDMGITEEQPFIVREYLPQGSLRSRLKLSPERLELREALRIVAQVGEALLYAHQRNIVHGNIKPENILLDANGQAFLTDFSLVDRKDAMIRDQASEEYAFCYLAPEQFAGTCDTRSDQFALGCLTYELISGRVPFAAQSLSSMMGRQSNVVPAPLSESVADLPPSLEVAVLKTLAKDPQERFFDFSLFLEVIQVVLSPPPAFPLVRYANSSKLKTISHRVPSVQIESIRKRASKRAASEQAEPPVLSLSAQNEMAEPAGTHPIVGASAPEQKETISQTELLTSASQSQLSISSLSLDTETDNTSPDDQFQEQNDSGASDMLVETMLLSQVFTAQLAMDRSITEEEQDEAWFTNPFVEEDPSSLGTTANSADEQEEDPTSNIVSLSTSSADKLGLMTFLTQRKKSKVRGLILVISVIVAMTTSGLWLSGRVPFGTSSYLAPFTRSNSQVNLKAIPTSMLVDIPNVRLQALPTVSATANSNPNVAMAISIPNAKNAGPNPSIAHTNSNPSTANTNSNPSTANTNSNPSTANTNSNPSTANTGSSPSSTTSTANSDPYPPSGTLTLSDPLRDNSRGYGWLETPPASSNGGWSCQFTGGAYYIQAQNGIYASCGTPALPGNFTLEAQMQIINGNCGGFTLRDGTHDGHGGNAYSFQVCQDGSYQFNVWHSFNIQTLTSGSSATIATGSNQSNLIAIVANGSHFDLYANHQMLASADDSSFTSGGFGLTANAAYTNARMWTL